jgi:hypothetical protein
MVQNGRDTKKSAKSLTTSIGVKMVVLVELVKDTILIEMVMDTFHTLHKLRQTGCERTNGLAIRQ